MAKHNRISESGARKYVENFTQEIKQRFDSGMYTGKEGIVYNVFSFLDSISKYVSKGWFSWTDAAFVVRVFRKIPRDPNAPDGTIERYLASFVISSQSVVDFISKPRNLALSLLASLATRHSNPEIFDSILKSGGPEFALFTESMELFSNNFLSTGGHPQFLVLGELVELFLQTDVKVPSSDVKLPYQALSIRWPKSVDIFPSNGKTPPANIIVVSHFALGLCFCALSENMRGLSGNLIYSDRIVDDAIRHQEIDDKLSPSHAASFRKMAKFVCNVVLYITNRQEDVLGDRIEVIDRLQEKLRSGRGNKERIRKKLSEERSKMIYIVGKKYRIKYPSGVSTLCMVARHMVRGHWRNQPYGPGREFIKQIWIEPHARGGKPTGKEPQPKDYAVI